MSITMDWLEANHEKLCEEYDGEWIAIKGQKVVWHGEFMLGADIPNGAFLEYVDCGPQHPIVPIYRIEDDDEAKRGN